MVWGSIREQLEPAIAPAALPTSVSVFLLQPVTLAASPVPRVCISPDVMENDRFGKATMASAQRAASSSALCAKTDFPISV